MRRIGKFPIVVSLVLVVILLSVGVAAASVTKFSFEDVTFSEDPVITGELEASSKIHPNKGDTFTTCSYFSEDYLTYLGSYESSQFGSTDAQVVLEFCVNNFENREVH